MKKIKKFILKWKLQIAHFAISLVVSLLFTYLSSLPFWVCFLIVEVSLIFNGYLATWEDLEPEEKGNILRPVQKVLRRVFVISLCFGLLVSLVFAWDIVEDRRHKIEVLEDTNLFADYTASYYPEKTVQVKAGEKLRVLRIRIPKHFMTVQVEKENGESGWLINGHQINLKQQGGAK